MEPSASHRNVSLGSLAVCSSMVFATNPSRWSERVADEIILLRIRGGARSSCSGFRESGAARERNDEAGEKENHRGGEQAVIAEGVEHAGLHVEQSEGG